MTQTQELADKIKDMANRNQGGGYTPAAGYAKPLVDMSDEDELSYPAYLLLTYCWNDALDWADNPKAYMKKEKGIELHPTSGPDAV